MIDPRALCAAEKFATTFDDRGLPLWLRSYEGFLAGVAWARDAAGTPESHPANQVLKPTKTSSCAPESPQDAVPPRIWISNRQYRLVSGGEAPDASFLEFQDSTPYVPETLLRQANEATLFWETQARLTASSIEHKNSGLIKIAEELSEQRERVQALETILNQARNKFEKIAAPPEFPARDKVHAEAQRDRCRLMAQEFLDKLAKAFDA